MNEWLWSIDGIPWTRNNRSTRIKTCSSAISSTMNNTLTDVRLKISQKEGTTKHTTVISSWENNVWPLQTRISVCLITVCRIIIVMLSVGGMRYLHLQGCWICFRWMLQNEPIFYAEYGDKSFSQTSQNACYNNPEGITWATAAAKTLNLVWYSYYLPQSPRHFAFSASLANVYCPQSRDCS